MKRGKRICNELKAVRRRIADENGIELHQSECKHTGNCRGTCPKCEAEVRYLEQALTRRLTAGRAATVAGLTLSLAACGGAAEPTLSVDTPLDTTLADTSCASDTVINAETDVPCPDIPIPGEEEIICGFELENDPSLNDELITEDEAIRMNLAPSEAINDEFLEGEPEIFVFVEEEPTFPGGEDAMYDFIYKNLQYPKSAECVTGTVVIKFVVEKDGRIGNVRIVREIGGGCGEEAARVVKMMPKWNPGKQAGKKVSCEFVLPIKFELQ
ncbi:MAG: energy transducer TonB [Bacteroidales bacterium]|nr:energy transducer TonB [Bacteroidales bacterium]